MSKPMNMGALILFVLLPMLVAGQDFSDKSWPALGSADENVWYSERSHFIIEPRKLKLAPLNSAPSWIPHCPPSSRECRPGLEFHVRVFYSELKGDLHSSTLRPEVLMHDYPYVWLDGHAYGTTYVFYLPKHNIFYFYGNCGMGHFDYPQGPFAGDPRLELKKQAEAPDALARLGFVTVPFHSIEQGWPAIPRSGIDVSKLEKAKGVVNPLSLDRCRASDEECVLNMEDFFSKRKERPGWERPVLRADVIPHFYSRGIHQYVFYLPKLNIFYVASHGPERITVSGPFAGDPKVALKKIHPSADAK